ncbi:hypothetical protein [Streptomyces sp. NPDC054786]
MVENSRAGDVQQLLAVEGGYHDHAVAASLVGYSAHGESRMVRTKSPRSKPGT